MTKKELPLFIAAVCEESNSYFSYRVYREVPKN